MIVDLTFLGSFGCGGEVGKEEKREKHFSLLTSTFSELRLTLSRAFSTNEFFPHQRHIKYESELLPAEIQSEVYMTRLVG